MVSSDEQEHLRLLEACLSSADGSLPVMAGNFQVRSLMLLQSLAVTLAAGLPVFPTVFTGQSPPIDPAVTNWIQVDSTGFVVERWQKKGGLWLSESQYTLMGLAISVNANASVTLVDSFPFLGFSRLWLESVSGISIIPTGLASGAKVEYFVQLLDASQVVTNYWLISQLGPVTAPAIVRVSEPMNQVLSLAQVGAIRLLIKPTVRVERSSMALVARAIYDA